MKKIIVLFYLIILLFIYIYISTISYVSAVSENISENIFRLHVIANSDSDKDQALKYLVRDNLIEYMNSLTQNISSKNEVIKIANEHKQDFYNIAIKTIQENGYDYDVKIEIGNFYFPTKTYGDVSFPCGYYDALKVEIGEAKR
jgi:stage II sporulation protein R